MLEIIREFPKICKDTLRKEISLPKDYRDIEKILISGMGGSAIAGDIIHDWLEERLKIPLIVNRNYKPPAFIDNKTLMIAISYSGNTKETLEQIKIALRKKCKIVGISSDGKMAKIFEKRKIPLIKVKEGIAPRAAIGYLLFSLINIFRTLGFVKLNKVSFPENPEKKAKKIAKKINNTIPIIYSIYPSVARRFKCQLNENSKIQARFEILPEAAHNDIEAFPELNEKFSLIFLRDEKNEREEIKKAFEFLKQNANNANVVEIFSKGKTKLERILYLIWVCDYISYFLAKERKVNPEDVPKIREFKKYVY